MNHSLQAAVEKTVLMLGALALAGCATSQFSALTQVDENTYRVSVHAISFRNREVEAFKQAQATASAQCAQDRLEVHPIKIEAGEMADLPADTVILTFRCLNESDPVLHRSIPVPDTIDRS